VERDRLTAALRLIWVIPQIVVLAFVYIGAFFVAIAGWLGALFTGELPDFAENSSPVPFGGGFASVPTFTS